MSKDSRVKEIRRLSRVRFGQVPKGKVIQNKKRFSRKKEKREIEEQLLDYLEGDNLWPIN